MKSYITRKKEIPFTQVSNQIIQDRSLSLAAKGLYALINSQITYPGYQLWMDTLKSQAGVNLPKDDCAHLSKKGFDRLWKELKTCGYLKQYRIRAEGGYLYEYELLDKPDLETPATQNVGLNGQICSAGNGRSNPENELEIEPIQNWNGSKIEPEIEPIQKRIGSKSEKKVEPIRFRTGFNSNLGSKGGDINNINKEDNINEKIDRKIELQRRKNDLPVENSKKGLELAALQDIDDHLQAHHQLPENITGSRLRSNEGVRLLTRYYEYEAVGEYYSCNTGEQSAYELLVNVLVDMCHGEPLKVRDERVRPLDVVCKLNEHITIEHGELGAYASIDALIAATIDDFRRAEITQQIKDRSAYMRACIWTRLCSTDTDYEENPEYHLAEKPGTGIDFPADNAQLTMVIQTRSSVADYIRNNGELPFDITTDQLTGTVAVHMLTHYDTGLYSQNKLQQAVFELCNECMIQMCLQEQQHPCGARVTNAKVWEKLNKNLSVDDSNPYVGYTLLPFVDAVVDDYRQAEMKKTIKNRFEYMRSCIWTRLNTDQVENGKIVEEIATYAQ